ncbi:MAG: c-type cytochrome, partial [Lysobacterales bacterium]
PVSADTTTALPAATSATGVVETAAVAPAATPTPTTGSVAPMLAGAPSEEALAAAREGNAQLIAAKRGDDEAGATKAGPCAACHSVDGNSADPVNPKIAGQSEWFIARQLMLFKSGVRQNAVMAPFVAPLNAQDMRDIGAYFATQSGRSGTADEGLVTAAGPHLGKKLYVVGEQLYRGGDVARGIPACMACHGPTGAGNPGAAFPRLTGQHAGYSQARLTRYRAGEMHGSARDNPNAPIMPAIARELTDLEISALATYIEGLHAFDPTAAVAALTPSAATSKEPVSAPPATTAPGAATIDSAAAPGPAAPASPNAAPQTPAGTDSGDVSQPDAN